MLSRQSVSKAAPAVQQAADTEWGRTHGFRDLLSAKDPIAAYQRRVPIQRYSDFESSIERMRRGAADVLWPGRCRAFGISGGTYSTGKVIPAQEEMLSRTIRSGVAMSINYLARTGNLSAVTGAIKAPSMTRRRGMEIGTTLPHPMFLRAKSCLNRASTAAL